MMPHNLVQMKGQRCQSVTIVWIDCWNKNYALDAGSLQDLREKYGDIQEADNFVYSKRTKPAITFKSKNEKINR